LGLVLLFVLTAVDRAGSVSGSLSENYVRHGHDLFVVTDYMDAATGFGFVYPVTGFVLHAVTHEAEDFVFGLVASGISINECFNAFDNLAEVRTILKNGMDDNLC
jgi:hypothetical protein